MNRPVMDLRELAVESGEADLLRKMIGFAAERLMEFEVGSQAGAGHGHKSRARSATMPSSACLPRRQTDQLGHADIRRASHELHREPGPDLAYRSFWRFWRA